MEEDAVVRGQLADVAVDADRVDVAGLVLTEADVAVVRGELRFRPGRCGIDRVPDAVGAVVAEPVRPVQRADRSPRYRKPPLIELASLRVRSRIGSVDPGNELLVLSTQGGDCLLMRKPSMQPQPK